MPPPKLNLVPPYQIPNTFILEQKMCAHFRREQKNYDCKSAHKRYDIFISIYKLMSTYNTKLVGLGLTVPAFSETFPLLTSH